MNVSGIFERANFYTIESYSYFDVELIGPSLFLKSTKRREFNTS